MGGRDREKERYGGLNYTVCFWRSCCSASLPNVSLSHGLSTGLIYIKKTVHIIK